MEMTTEVLSEGRIKITLAGSMNATSTEKIDLRFNAEVGAAHGAIVDFEKVDFLASMGIRTLVIAAKALKRKSGRMIILKPIPEVEQVLISSGVDSLMDIAHDLDTAVAMLVG